MLVESLSNAPLDFKILFVIYLIIQIIFLYLLYVKKDLAHKHLLKTLNAWSIIIAFVFFIESRRLDPFNRSCLTIVSYLMGMLGGGLAGILEKTNDKNK